MAGQLSNTATGRVFYVGSPAEVEHFAAPQRKYHNVIVCEPDELVATVQAGDVCIFYNEFFTKFRECCLFAKARGCATIYAIDGILEWRNLWEFPSDSGSCLWTMRPVLADKVACIGRSQARLLESWGNVGKCEVVGIPRFDILRDRAPRVRSNEPFTLLIMTAKNPGFTQEQRDTTQRSLMELKAWIDSYNSQNTEKILPIWRVTAGLAEKIGVTNHLRETTGADLASLLQQVDAVVTTPSTAILEAMLYRLPVAILDFTNSPQYVSAAWSMTAREHFDFVIPQLMEFPESRRLLQQTLLHDHLECETDATPRMTTLIDEMLRIVATGQNGGLDHTYPHRILQSCVVSGQSFELGRLFPEHFMALSSDALELQAEINHLRLELARKSKQLQPFDSLVTFANKYVVTRAFLGVLKKVIGNFHLF